MYIYDYLSRTAEHRQRQPEYKCLLSSDALKSIFSSCADFQMREIYFGLDASRPVSLCWLDGIISGTDAAENIIRPMTDALRFHGTADERQTLTRILSGGVYGYSAKQRSLTDEVVGDLTHGCAALIFDGLHQAVCFEVRSDKSRAVSEPTLEKSLKGAKDAFTETLRVNTALIRRRICTPQLKVLESRVGRKTHTQVSMLFLDGVASPETVQQLAQRLDALDTDGLLATGVLEEFIVDSPRSLFPQLLHTERPDRFAMYLAEGRVGLLIDGLPIGLVLPVTLADFMKVTGDYCNNYIVASALTVLRYLALLLSVTLPAFYVAVAMFHQEMIPTKLLLSIIEAKQDVPFSTATEVLGMLISFELLQEAGLRLPNPIGDTVSIIGALIVGQSAVEARVISPIAIIVVAFAGIAGYTLPSQDLGSAVRVIRFTLVLAAIAAGLFGVSAVLCLVLLHLCSIDSFGADYTAPLSDNDILPLVRLLILPPKPEIKFHDPILKTPDKRRQK